MPTRPIGLLSRVFCVLLTLSGIARAADPAPSATAAATTQGDTPPTDAAAAAGADTPPATTSPTSASIDQAMPAAPEPLLLARLEAKTLGRDFIKLGSDAEPFLARFRAATKPAAVVMTSAVRCGHSM